MIKSKILKIIIEEHQIKHGTEIDYEFLNTISRRHNIKIKDLIQILGIVPIKEYINIKRFLKKNKYMIRLYNDQELFQIYQIIFKENQNILFTKKQIKAIGKKFYIEESIILDTLLEVKHKEEEINLKKKISKELENEDYITKKQVEDLKHIYKVSNAIIKECFGINDKNFDNLMKEKTNKTKIVAYEIIKKAFMIKMDFKYFEANKFHTKRQLISKCKYWDISLENILKNISDNEKRYKFSLLALENNKKGIYIGEEHPMSIDFINENYEKIINICKRNVIKYKNIYRIQNSGEEILSAVVEKILRTGGILEKTFLFNNELLFSLIASRSKYAVLNECNKQIREKVNISKNILNLLNVYERNEEGKNIFKIYEKCLEESQIKIIKEIWKNIQMIEIDRVQGMKNVAENLNFKYAELRKNIKNIQQKMIENKLVRKCKNGTVIITEID